MTILPKLHRRLKSFPPLPSGLLNFRRLGTEAYLLSGRERKKIETLFGDVKRNLRLTGTHQLYNLTL